MRFLADENIPGATVSALANSGHDIAWMRTRAPGAGDAEVLALAIAEARILLTFDKDFGERARAADLPPTCGVVLIRLPMRGSADTARLAQLINERSDWSGCFSVIEPGRVRMRPLHNVK
jgi:predicted nuclease of predicted toxin-antitoxin system